MGQPFRSGHVLGLRRWTASSVEDHGFTSIWHRDPSGRWTFYESVDAGRGCGRYFGADVSRVEVGPIDLTWETPNRLRIQTANSAVDWTVETGSTLVTRLVSALGVALPDAVWRSRIALAGMGAVAGRLLGAGRVQLTGQTSNAQHFEANPRRIWCVTNSQATVEGVDLGRPGPLAEQARIADFYLPQRGLLAVGRVFVTYPAEAAPGSQDDIPKRSRREVRQ